MDASELVERESGDHMGVEPPSAANRRKMFTKLESIAHEVGREGDHLERGAHTGRSLAVFTSGGDSQGVQRNGY